MAVGKDHFILKGFSEINVNCLTPKRSKSVVILLPHRTVLIAHGFDIFNTLSENMSNKMSVSLSWVSSQTGFLICCFFFTHN